MSVEIAACSCDPLVTLRVRQDFFPVLRSSVIFSSPYRDPTNITFY